jgi:hypothetical protein
MKEIIMKGRNIRKGIKMNLEIKEIPDENEYTRILRIGKSWRNL